MLISWSGKVSEFSSTGFSCLDCTYYPKPRIINLAESGDQAAAIALLVNPDVRKANTEYRQAIEAFVDYQVKVTHEVAEAAKAESEHAKYGLMMGSIILIIMMVFIALFISRRINSVINGLVTEITAIAKGMRFNQRLTTRQDEFDMVAVSLNQLLSQVEQGLQETNRVMAAIADGDFSERMKHEYAGDMALLKTNTNNSAGEIASVMQQITKAMNALKAGYFSVELSRKAPGDYGVMLTNTATAFSEISAVIKDINQRMSEFKAGKLDQRVTVASSGELKMLGNSVNETLQTIGQLTGDLVRLANAQLEGDLTQSSTGHYEGVYKELVEARVRSSERIKEVLNHATRTAYVVSTASEQVANGAGDLSQRVQQQAAALEETSATMNEIATTVQNNTENAQQVAKLSNDVKAQSLNGVAVMQKTINAIQSISESSQKINEIVTLIDGIAFQTNLLALNAAVEAARAGEHGRGFAVVAGEVRALAQKSSEAASDIKHLINESVIRVEAGTELAERSGVVLNQISDSITSVASMVGQIAEASHEQAIGISQVHKALIDIDRITQENATLVEDTTSSAENLRTESTMLSDNLAFFNTGAQLPVEKAVRKSPVHAKKILALPPTSSHTEWSDF